jgi:hypothetical protein
MPDSMPEQELALAHPPAHARAVGIGWRHPHYAALLQQLPDVDFLEVHSENFFAPHAVPRKIWQQGRMHYPISLHGVGLSLGSAHGLDPWHLDQLAELVRAIDPVRVSDHVSFARVPWRPGEHVNAGTTHACDLLPLPLHEQALSVLSTHINQVQDRLGRRFAVENISAYLRWKSLPRATSVTEPEFLNALAKNTGCGLIVDVNNVFVNALNAHFYGETVNPVDQSLAWLDAIDPGAVVELHLAGHGRLDAPHNALLDGMFIDDHSSQVCDAVWSLYSHALQRFGPVPTLIEWDTAIPPLDTLLQQAKKARLQLPWGAHA